MLARRKHRDGRRGEFIDDGHDSRRGFISALVKDQICGFLIQRNSRNGGLLILELLQYDFDSILFG